MNVLFIVCCLIVGIFLNACSATGPNLIGEGSNISVALHEDIEAAAKYAEANGYPERAAVRRAIGAQIKACEQAISAAKPKMPDGRVGPILLAEMAEEAVASGVPARVKALCAPVPIPRF